MIGAVYGSNGGYKTASVVRDYIREAAYKGRTIVTNIRGVDALKIRQLIYRYEKKRKCPRFEVIYVDTDIKEGKEKMRRFFHWAPKKALIIIDEIQAIYPQSFTAKEMAQYELDQETADREGRPVTIEQSFDMHRHLNWDIIYTTPNITKVRREIRDTTENARKNQNMAFIGLSGFYQYKVHHGTDTGKSDKDIISVHKMQRIPKHVFAMYQSTATGIVQDSSAGTPIWKNPKIVGLVSLLVIYWTYVFTKPAPKVLSNEQNTTNQAAQEVSKESVSTDKKTPDSDTQKHTKNNKVHIDKISRLTGDWLRIQDDDDSDIIEPYQGFQFAIKGSIRTNGHYKYFLSATLEGRKMSVTHEQLQQVGYAIIGLNDCLARLKYRNFIKQIYCEAWEDSSPEQNTPSSNGPVSLQDNSIAAN